MPGFKAFATALVAVVISTWLTPIASGQQSSIVNKGVVELETSGSAGISVKIAEDLANLIDDGATRRVLPIIGKSALQNLIDLKYLHGIDMAVLPMDVFDYAKENRLLLGQSMPTYITRLYNEEFHLLARDDIKSIGDLSSREVAIDVAGSSTAITATRIFSSLNIPVKTTNDNPRVALQKLRSGQIAAVAFVSGKPAPLFLSFPREKGLHFVPVPIKNLATSAYVPARLTAADYESLIPEEQAIDTVAVGSVLAVADLRQAPERYRRVANFVDAFFTGFQSLLAPGHHPKWKEVNLSAELPGWQRYAPAEQWLQRNQQLVGNLNPDELRVLFSRFVDQRREASGQAPMTIEQKNELFQQFRAWQGGRVQ
jgi:TRAP-type uncharacterized transport system substrate-binding protein